MKTFYGVYRDFKNGTRRYVSRSVTNNKGLAEDIAKSLSRGEIVMPDGSIRYVPARPHSVHVIRDDKK